MKLKIDIKQEILNTLKEAPQTASEVAEKLHLSSEKIRKRIGDLKIDRQVYVSEWRDVKYSFVKVYSLGCERDAPTPNRKIAGPRKQNLIRGLSPNPIRIKSSREVVFRREFFDDLAFKVVSGRSATC